MTLTRDSLADLLAAETGCARRASREMVRTLFRLMGERLADGDTLRIQNFGTFTHRAYAQRALKSGLTGQVVQLPARTRVQFKPAPRLHG